MARWMAGIGSLIVLLANPVQAAEPTAAERGQKALCETAFIKAFWPKPGYDNLWRVWGLAEKPKDYEAAVRDRFGLHPAPFPNDGLPMGLRKADLLVGKGIAIDCLVCHGGSLLGKSYIGLGNVSLDIHTLFEELGTASGNPFRPKFAFTQVRGTNEAGAFAIYLLGLRKPDLTLTPDFRDLGLKDDSCEDVPAWWLLKKKRTMYHVGSTDARSVRSMMQFLMHPLTVPEEFHRAEPAFRDIQQYLFTLEPPKYPFPIDTQKAKRGEELFNSHCVKCHGRYGDAVSYPNKIIPLEEIGTDRKRYENVGPEFSKAINESWFGKEPGGWFLKGKLLEPTAGYQAPPLDGVWATAPYFHNGAVPTLYGVLNSRERPKIFTRSFRTAEEDFDQKHVGWKVRRVQPADPKVPGAEQRKTYDTTKPGRGNQGHTYGDELTEEERWAIIEYLKTL